MALTPETFKKFTTEERITRILTAPPATLNVIDKLLDGEFPYQDAQESYKLLTITDAARMLAVSRSTIYRLLADGELTASPFRMGRVRIPEVEIARFASRKQTAQGEA